MQTYIRGDEADLENLGVSHELKIGLDAINDYNYWTIRPPQPGEATRLIQSWTCPECESPTQWASITIQHDRIADMAAVPLNKQTLGDAHFISGEAESVAADLLGRPQMELLGKDPVPVLMERL